LAAFPAKAMACLRALVPCEWAAYEELNAPQGRIVGACDPVQTRPNAGQLAVFMEYLHQHPVVDYFTKSEDRRARTISDFLPRWAYVATGIYNEFYRDMGTADQLGLFVAAPKPLMIVLAVSRTRRSFTARDRAMFDVLQPHLLQAYRNAEAITGLAGGDGWAIDAIEATEQAVIWLTQAGRVRTCTPQARRWLSEYFPTVAKSVASPVTALLPDSLRRWVDRSTAMHGDAMTSDDVPVASTTFAVRGAAGMLQVRLVPGRRDEGFLLIMVECRDERSSLSKGTDPRLGGLSPRSRRVLEALLKGMSEKEAAAALDLSIHTVHEYVKQIYRTLGVCSRGELLARWVSQALPPKR
jgi:DNA-binding CsgD family transcriptional regulator